MHCEHKMEERNKIYEQFYHSDLLYFLDFFPPDPALRARALLPALE